MVNNIEAIKSKEVIHSALQSISNSLKEQQIDIKENFDGDIKDINKLVNISNELVSEFSTIQTSDEFAKFFKKNESFIKIGMESITKHAKKEYTEKLNKIKQTLDLAYTTQIDKRDQETNNKIKEENNDLYFLINSFIDDINSRVIITTKDYILSKKDFENYLDRINDIVSNYNNIRSKDDFIKFFENIKINEDDSDKFKEMIKNWLERAREMI